MSYADAHANSTGPGDARPTALQIVKDDALEGKLTGKVAVVTGTSSGIGIETARALAATGLKLILPVRSLDKAKEALSFLDPQQHEFVYMDQTSLESVRAAAKEVLAKTEKINLLVNNAAIMAVPDLQHSKDGYELQFATNHLSHFLFFELLKPTILASSTPEWPSRVVNVSSDGHCWKGINDSGNYNFEKGEYDGFASYAQSKTANVYMTNEIDRRYGSKGLHANSIHPGVIMTGLGRFMTEEQVQGLLNNDKMSKYWKSPEQGAATTVWAAVANVWKDAGGKYLANCAVTEPGYVMGEYTGGRFAEHTYHPEHEARLWKDSLAMVGLPAEN